MSEKKPATAQLPEGVTDGHVAAWKREHGKVHRVAVTKDGKVYVGLFKKPTLTIMSAAASVGNDPIAQGDLVYNSCKLAVDPGMDSDDEVHLAAMKLVGGLFRALEGEVGEL